MEMNLPLFSHAWTCTCGHLNSGRHGASNYSNEDGTYEVCGGCRFEIYDEYGPRHKMRLARRFLLVPVKEPWKLPESKPCVPPPCPELDTGLWR